MDTPILANSSVSKEMKSFLSFKIVHKINKYKYLIAVLAVIILPLLFLGAPETATLYTLANSQNSSGKYSWYGAPVSTKVAPAEVGIYEGEISGLSSRIFHTIVNDWEPEGQGTLTWSDGRKYVGEWKDGKYHRQGTFTWSDGRKYVGEWKDGKYHRQGTFTWSDGRKYVGEWKDGKKHGQGTENDPSGHKYVGEYKDGLPNGQGTFTYPNGQKYIGQWKDGEEHGQGSAVHPSGLMKSGIWKNGEFVKGW